MIGKHAHDRVTENVTLVDLSFSYSVFTIVLHAM